MDNIARCEDSVAWFCMVFGLGLAACGGSSPTSTTVPLKVTSVDITVAPSLNGHTCGSQFTEIYMATFHFPANNVGGQGQFQYTTNNGRGSTQASLTVPPGQTSAIYQFTWSGQLPADHTAPGIGIVLMSAPNQGESQQAIPNGSCS